MRGNPLESIQALEKVVLVMKAGTVYLNAESKARSALDGGRTGQ